MASKKIITIDVGGQLFETDIRTLTKYPDTMVAKMFEHSEEGITPMLKKEDGNYFLDADPIYFREILNFLRFGKLTLQKEEPCAWEGVLQLANYLGLYDQIMNEREKIETQPEKNGVITLSLNGEKEITILRSVLTEVYPNYALAKYFSMNHRSPWIMKENPGRYYICRIRTRVSEMVFKFLMAQTIVVNSKTTMGNLEDELSFYGIKCRYKWSHESEFRPHEWCQYSIIPHGYNASAKKDEDFSFTFKWTTFHNFE